MAFSIFSLREATTDRLSDRFVTLHRVSDFLYWLRPTLPPLSHYDGATCANDFIAGYKCLRRTAFSSSCDNRGLRGNKAIDADVPPVSKKSSISQALGTWPFLFRRKTSQGLIKTLRRLYKPSIIALKNPFFRQTRAS